MTLGSECCLRMARLQIRSGDAETDAEMKEFHFRRAVFEAYTAVFYRLCKAYADWKTSLPGNERDYVDHFRAVKHVAFKNVVHTDKRIVVIVNGFDSFREYRHEALYNLEWNMTQFHDFRRWVMDMIKVAEMVVNIIDEMDAAGQLNVLLLDEMNVWYR